MGVSLHKGQGVSLRKADHDLAMLTIGLGWDVVQASDGGGADYDLDAIAFVLNGARQVENLGRVDHGRYTLEGGDVVFFNSMHHTSGAVWLTGDNRTGAGEGADDEQIIVQPDALPDRYSGIVFVVSIYKGAERGQHFGAVANAYIRAVDAQGREMARFDISGDASLAQCRSVTFAEVVREAGGWAFCALGTPHATDRFVDILKEYLPT